MDQSADQLSDIQRKLNDEDYVGLMDTVKRFNEKQKPKPPVKRVRRESFFDPNHSPTKRAWRAKR